jgi:hypothetical protein
MAFTSNFDASNTADFILDISATDGDTNSLTFGQDIDFTGAAVSFVIQDDNCVTRLTATIGSGITQPTGNVLEVKFTSAQMQTLCAGNYNVGCVFKLNGETDQLLTGSMSVYNGRAMI